MYLFTSLARFTHQTSFAVYLAFIIGSQFTRSIRPRTVYSPSPSSFEIHDPPSRNSDMVESLSSSPISADAVTASEGNESDTKDGSNANTRKSGASDLREVVTSNPGLGPSLSDFLEKLAPWKGIMPGDLVNHMEFLEDTAEEMRRTEETVK